MDRIKCPMCGHWALKRRFSMNWSLERLIQNFKGYKKIITTREVLSESSKDYENLISQLSSVAAMFGYMLQRIPIVLGFPTSPSVSQGTRPAISFTLES